MTTFTTLEDRRQAKKALSFGLAWFPLLIIGMVEYAGVDVPRNVPAGTFALVLAYFAYTTFKVNVRQLKERHGVS